MEHENLVAAVSSSFNLDSGAQQQTAASYVGGEARVPGARTTDVVVAFPVAPADAITARIAAMILGAGSLTRSALKAGHGRAGRLNQDVVGQHNIQEANAFSSTYSDAGLFGIRAHALGPGNADIVSAVADQFKALAAGVTEEECTRAKNAFKGLLLDNQASQAGLHETIGQVATSGNVSADLFNDMFTSVDGVTPAAVQNVVANAIKQNPSIASVGDIADVPRYDAVASLF